MRYVAEGGDLWSLAADRTELVDSRLAVWLSRALTHAGWAGTWRPAVVAKALAAAHQGREQLAEQRAEERRQAQLEAEAVARHRWAALGPSIEATLGEVRATWPSLRPLCAELAELAVVAELATGGWPLVEAVRVAAERHETLRSAAAGLLLEQRRAARRAACEAAREDLGELEALLRDRQGRCKAESERLLGLRSRLPKLGSVVEARRAGRWGPEERQRRMAIRATRARWEARVESALELHGALVTALRELERAQVGQVTPEGVQGWRQLVERADELLVTVPEGGRDG